MAVLVRAGAAGATKEFAAHLASQGVEFSFGAGVAHPDIHTALAALPKQAWTPAYQACKPRAAELSTGCRSSPATERGRRGHRADSAARLAKDTGLRNLPFHDTAQDRIWVAIAALAADVLPWCALALPASVAGYEPKRTAPTPSPQLLVGKLNNCGPRSHFEHCERSS